jgi:hypothetical protein
VVFVGNGRAKQGHNAIAEHLIHRALEAVHGVHHHLDGGIEELLGGFGVETMNEFGRVLEIGKQHRDLLALALQGGAGGEDFFGQIGGRVGKRRTVLGACWNGGREGHWARVPDPHQDSARLIGSEVLGLNEFLFEGFEGFVIQLELDLERPIRHALTLTEEGNHLIEDDVKLHRAPSCTCGGQYGPTTAHGQTREATRSMYRT